MLAYFHSLPAPWCVVGPCTVVWHCQGIVLIVYRPVYDPTESCIFGMASDNVQVHFGTDAGSFIAVAQFLGMACRGGLTALWFWDGGRVELC